MPELLTLEKVFPDDFIHELRERALNCFARVKEDYFSEMPENDYQLIYQDINSVARCISVRFFDQQVMTDIYNYLLPHIVTITERTDYLFCPLFTLRLYHPNQYVSAAHEKAFLQTEPHYDNGFGNYGISVWLPLQSIDQESGGLCEFTTDEIHTEFPESGKNRFNFDTYLEDLESIDPLLRNGTQQSTLSNGDVLIHFNALHGATKPKGRSRLSFNFRLIPETELSDKEKNIQDLYRLMNKSLTLFRALNLANLGDRLGAERLVADNSTDTPGEDIGKMIEHFVESGMLWSTKLTPVKVHWSDEFKWSERLFSEGLLNA